jgi:CheY-like chemotaxis protein
MSKELKLLYIEDDETNRNDLVRVLQDETLGDFSIKIEAVDTFDNAIEKIESNQYHIIVLDIYKGKPDDGGEQTGLEILKQIQARCFVPVIFYSGNTKNVHDLKSQIVGVVTKGDEGIDGLKAEIERLVKFNLPFVKENVHDYLEKEFKIYFGDIIHKERDKFVADNNDFSLGYLMLRKFGNSLSKEKISEILGDSELNKDKVHSMEFYLYPTDTTKEYQCGELLEIYDHVFVILTPSCDFIERFDKSGKSIGRKVGLVLLAKTKLLTDTTECQEYNLDKTNNGKKNDLIKLINSGKGDRYFFLPQTPFITNRIIDFQTKEMVEYKDLNAYTRIAKLDSPYAESMVASFIRYYNRIGYPDIDSDLILSAL